MNYRIFFCGKLTTTFDEVMRLIIESARESDYVVHTFARPVLSPFSTIMIEAHFIGSSKKEMTDIVVDFDNVYRGKPVPIKLSSDVLNITLSDTFSHCWGVVGALFKVITDLSTAYITSYLLDKNMNTEMALYKQYTMASLPLDLQEIIAQNAAGV